MKEPDKVLLPSSNFILVVLREDESEDCILFALLADLPLHLSHGSAIDTSVSESPVMCMAVLLT
jgi:hypothetical protein